MELKDLYKLKSHYPKDTQVVIRLNDGQVITSFDMEFKFTSEGKWIAVIIPKSKVDKEK